jgi:uncharacterized protein Yka (UPF0111/DUF47 family)
LQGTIAATKDRALIGLGRLGEALSQGTSQPTEEWRENVHQALTETIEAMVSFEELADDLRDEKRQELPNSTPKPVNSSPAELTRSSSKTVRVH